LVDSAILRSSIHLPGPALNRVSSGIECDSGGGNAANDGFLPGGFLWWFLVVVVRVVVITRLIVK
jgi:hypothetical protein